MRQFWLVKQQGEEKRKQFTGFGTQKSGSSSLKAERRFAELRK